MGDEYRAVRIEVEVGERTVIRESLTEEAVTQIVLDGKEIVTLSCTPSDLEYLITGYLISGGYIRSARQIDRLQLNREVSPIRADVLTRRDGGFREPSAVAAPSCRISPEQILRSMRHLSEPSDSLQMTGAVHCSAVFRGDDLLFAHEDISRHNTVDKVVGHLAHCPDINPSPVYLCTTGRLFSGMVGKCAAAGIPLVVTRKAATDRTIHSARRNNITVIGYARENRMTVYTYPERVAPR